MQHVFIDGNEGTTGLRIFSILKDRTDLCIMSIEKEDRKNPSVKKEILNDADLVILCLPDEAAKESVSLISNPKTRVIDTSTAHRVQPGWTYGFPELSSDRREMIASAALVANPGCHATGFIALVYPLVSAGILPADYPASCQSLTGYSGGGKRLIGFYKGYKEKDRGSICMRPYALGLRHKHLREMQHLSGLDNPPVFTPVVGDVYNGMLVSVPIVLRHLLKKVRAEDLHGIYERHYQGEPFVRVMPLGDVSCTSGGFLDITACNQTNRLDIFVFGHDEQVLVAARLDNLGKGASGAAVQNMNLMLGMVETEGLRVF